MKTYKLLGCPCAAVSNSKQAQQQLANLVHAGKGGYSVAINAEKISRYRIDAELRSVIYGASFVYPDGAGAVLGLLWLHRKKSNKINFPLVALETANQHRWRVFLLGAKEEINAFAAKKIANEYPNIQIVGRANGYKSDDELTKLVSVSNPQLIMLALGSPKQEFWAEALQKKNINAFCVGCGGAFDIMAGRLKRAPEFMINNNMEWLYRVIQEPFRWRRQLVLPIFMSKLIWEVFLQRLGFRS
jgi:N-acetylglucosaminyldiphosphoundecaprenol N-acetyl-beta-D-mannosaminyltransferase